MIKHLAQLVLMSSALIALQSQAKTHLYDGDGGETWTKKLKAGDELVIPNGTYADLKINAYGKGDAQNPITVRAETPGGVVLTGESWLRYWGYYIVVEGFDFQNVKPSTFDGKIRPLIANRRAGSSSEKSKDMCHGCVLQRIRIDNEAPEASSEEYKWVEVYGYENFIRYNYFGAKKSASRVLQVQLKHANAEGIPARHRIFGNYFASRNVGQSVGNGGEALLVGDSKMQHVDAQVLVEGNLFFDASITGEPEVISNKSSSNVYRHNTIRETSAGLTLRHGDRNTVEYNWVLQAGKEGGSGIRVIGDDNVVVNNYMDGVAGGGKSAVYRTALGIVAGYSKKDDDANINGYQPSEGNILSFNTVVASAQPVMLSTWYDRKELSMTRPPLNTSFTHNLVYQNGVAPVEADWVRGLAISADFTPESDYGNQYGKDTAEFYPTYDQVAENLTDGQVSSLLAPGTVVQPELALYACDAFGTGDLVYDAVNGVGADLSKMRAPLLWTEERKSPRLGPDWLNPNWATQTSGYTACEQAPSLNSTNGVVDESVH